MDTKDISTAAELKLLNQNLTTMMSSLEKMLISLEKILQKLKEGK